MPPPKKDDSLAKESDVTVGGAVVPPETEYFGFALYVGSSVVALAYMNWALMPRSWLQALDIYYYPSRWWALAIPSFLVMTLVYIYVALASYNKEVMTYAPDRLETITDIHAKMIDEDLVDRYLFTPNDGVRDLPISRVNQILYGSR